MKTTNFKPNLYFKEEDKKKFRRWLHLKWHYYWQLWGGFFYIVEKYSDKDENCEKLKLEVSDKNWTESSERFLPWFRVSELKGLIWKN